MRRGSLLLLLVVVLATSLSAAGTIAVTVAHEGTLGLSRATTRYTIAWTSASDGTTTGNAFAVVGGRIEKIEFIPNTGATQPTDAYDATLVTANGLDVLTVGGTSYGANLSNATTKAVVFDPPLLLDAQETLDLRLTNAGNAKTGTVRLWMTR